MSKFLSRSPFETKKIGKAFGKKFLKIKKPSFRAKKKNKLPARRAYFEPGEKKGALVLGLEGDLGGGKTTFLQGFAKGLGIKQRITSPTFVIMKKYEVRGAKKRKRQFLSLQASRFKLYHIDCYRLKRVKEILSIGFKEIISNPQNIVAIEWADRIKKILPKDVLLLKFKIIDKSRREIKVVVK